MQQRRQQQRSGASRSGGHQRSGDGGGFLLLIKLCLGSDPYVDMIMADGISLLCNDLQNCREFNVDPQDIVMRRLGAFVGGSTVVPWHGPWHELGAFLGREHGGAWTGSLARARQRLGTGKTLPWQGNGLTSTIRRGVFSPRGGMGTKARETLEHALGEHAKARPKDHGANHPEPIPAALESLRGGISARREMGIKIFPVGNFKRKILARSGDWDGDFIPSLISAPFVSLLSCVMQDVDACKLRGGDGKLQDRVRWEVKGCWELLVVSWHMKAATMCEFSKQEFIGGLQALGIDSLEKFRERLPYMRTELKDDNKFREIYNFAFGWAKEKGQKSLALDTAIGMWQLLFAEKQWPLVDCWCQFLQARHNKAISRDTWSQLLEFARTVNPTLSNYDPQGAWPYLIDEFVEYLYENNVVQKNC
ncbi:hypothetical protein Scep_014206 [Stephania cephalantha]|uniref:Defective in cullin neddylation protein n=1 Tax=Stephania cephalantha TaxID=152367 RepID=A0AAP0J1K6_9MAGN